ncbi:MAG: glucuronate isomerase [Gemmataceae bacterium]
MSMDALAASLYDQILQIPLIDPHTHINPLRPASRSLDDILGYHYYTELAHSAGMSKEPLGANVDPRERVRAILGHMDRYSNTVQYAWFLEIARTFLGFQGHRLGVSDATWLCDQAEKLMAQPDWEQQVLIRSNLEQVFLTNEFDDPLEGFDTQRYVPCLRTDDLVFKLDHPGVRERLARATQVDVGDAATARRAVTALFEHFTRKNARACAISLPPDFSPLPVSEQELTRALNTQGSDEQAARIRARGLFWILADHCRSFRLPFDLMIGVNRRVYVEGVFQGQDLFDSRLSLIQYAELFNAFPTVPFCISVLSSGLNQELVSYAWIFPNVITSGHWWYANIPAFIESDLQARLEAVPRTKQIGYYSDMYKLEFALPKYNMYRRVLARVLAERFIRTGLMTEKEALDVARHLLRGNVQSIFGV